MHNPPDYHMWNRNYTEAVILGSHVLYADSRIAALSLENHWAARYWSEGTRWCIASKSIFQDYRERGRLLLFRVINEDRRYLLSPSWLEFRNDRNRRMSLTAFIDRFPKIEPAIRSIMQNDWRALFYFNLAIENMRIEHSLDLTALGISSLPKHLRVRDDLVLRHNPIGVLPRDLWVGGNLDVRETNISEIPAAIRVFGKVFTNN